MRYFPDTTDPAPSFDDDSQYTDVQLNSILMDSNQPLFHRFQALFTLRDRILQAIDSDKLSENLGSLLGQGLFSAGSALLRHEVAFVLGQLSLSSTVNQLNECVKSENEHPMVRHEAAEALGSVLGSLESKFLSKHSKSQIDSLVEEEARNVLVKHANDSVQLVRESCVLALDIADYISSSSRFQYACVPEK